MIEMGIGAHLTRILADDGEQVLRALLSEAWGQCRDGRPAASLTTTFLPRKEETARAALGAAFCICGCNLRNYSVS